MTLRILASMIVMLGASACTGLGRDLPECEAPLLAAGPDLRLGLSCAELITYDDTTYYIGCAPVHRSRVGDPFLDDGGDTRFSGARSVEGLSRSKVFLVLGDTDGCPEDELTIAVSDAFTRVDAGLMRVPVDTPDELRLARERAPWIIPGRNEYPDALRLDAELSGDGITVTNRNRCRWRRCEQIQINDDIEKVWETGEYLDSLAPGASYTWALDDFDIDDGGIRELSEDEVEEIEGLPFIIMCRAPRGLASGSDEL